VVKSRNFKQKEKLFIRLLVIAGESPKKSELFLKNHL